MIAGIASLGALCLSGFTVLIWRLSALSTKLDDVLGRLSDHESRLRKLEDKTWETSLAR